MALKEQINFRNATRVARISKLKEARREGRQKVILVWDDKWGFALFSAVLTSITEKLKDIETGDFSVVKSLGRAPKSDTVHYSEDYSQKKLW